MLAMYLKYHKAGLTPTTSVTSTAISSVKMAIGHKSLTGVPYRKKVSIVFAVFSFSYVED
jgi:hypothetical protein